MKITMNGVTFEGITMEQAKEIIAAAMNTTTAVVTAAAPAVARTLAQAKHDSFTERLFRGAVVAGNTINKGVLATGTWTADGLSTVEVKAVPAIVSSTGYVCAKSATTLDATSKTLSSWATRLAAARVAMEFSN